MHVIDSGLCRVSIFWLTTCSYLRLCQKVSGPCYWALLLVARATSFVVAFVVLLDGDCREHSLTPIVVTSSCSLEYITMDMFLYLTCSLIPHTLTHFLHPPQSAWLSEGSIVRMSDSGEIPASTECRQAPAAAVVFNRVYYTSQLY